jgi:hypothetical protein
VLGTQAMEQQQSAEAIEHQSKVDSLLTALNKQSIEEQRITERLLQLQRERDVLAENRQLREEQYEERRQQDWKEGEARENEVARSVKVLPLSTHA